MSAVGVYLRDLRERQGVSLEELSRSTRVLHHYLEALETDDLASLPAPVFTKGFIRAYCQVLGVSSDESIALDDLRAGQRRVPTGSFAVPPPPALALHPRSFTSERRAVRVRGPLLLRFELLLMLRAALFAFIVA